MAKDQGKDARRSPRLPVGFSVTFQTAGALRQAMAANLSTGGMFIESEEAVPRETVLEISISIPLRQEKIVLKGKVVHVQEKDVATGRPAGLGIEFLELKDAQKKVPRTTGCVATARRAALGWAFDATGSQIGCRSRRACPSVPWLVSPPDGFCSAI